MPRFEVEISAHYEFDAADEEAAYYMGVEALKRDLPNNAAPLEYEAHEIARED